MPHDPARLSETRDWLVRARHDLEGASLLIPSLPDLAVFHCQQAVEKTLKAFLAFHDVPFRKTHELEELGTQCSALDESLELEPAFELTPFAWRFRYPGGASIPDPDDAAQALSTARSVFETVVSRLPAQARPDA